MGIDPLTNEELFEDVEFDGKLLKVLAVTAGDVARTSAIGHRSGSTSSERPRLRRGALTWGRSEVASSPRF